MAADVSQITSVGLKLIPVALIGKSDNCVDLVSAHELADAGPAALALNMGEFWKPETTFAAIDHGRADETNSLRINFPSIFTLALVLPWC